MFASVLVANRGEIAVRIMQTCREMGITCIAVYSDADAGAYHVRAADRAYRIGGSPAAMSYLNIAAIMEAAKTSGAEAIHPGYGFLSENSEFARVVLGAGLVWVGPPPGVIDALGDKPTARRAAINAGVPVVPGYGDDDLSLERLELEAASIGYPVMLKAAAGGGGRGMRVVHHAADFQESLLAAQRESRAAFGDDRVFLEKLLEQPRHVEFQIAADAWGNVIHLGERECSLQRRHQKVVEEAPSPGLDKQLRAAMGAGAVEIARQSGYQSLGTVEFLVSQGRFYFLEVNTRIQVEHPVTEAVTGLDLVALQLCIASGERLALSQSDVRIHGHAIEARIYAEDPSTNFLPSTGTVAMLDLPAGIGIRVDAGVQPGDDITTFYDPMIAKLSVHAETRDTAVHRLTHSLARFSLTGVRTNIPFLTWIATRREFLEGSADVEFIDREWTPREASPTPPEAFIALGLWLVTGYSRDKDPWRAESFWRSAGVPRRLVLAADGQTREISLHLVGSDRWLVELGGQKQLASVLRVSAMTVSFTLENEVHRATVEPISTGYRVDYAGVRYHLSRDIRRSSQSRAGGTDSSSSSATSPMPGTVVRVLVTEGQAIATREPLAIVEAMKMEHVVQAAGGGTVRTVMTRAGDVVAAGQILVQIDANE